MSSSTTRKGRLKGRALFAILAITALLALGVSAATGQEGSDDPIDSAWLAVQDAAAPASVQNNLVDGAIARRDQAAADWRAANDRYQQAKQQAAAAPAGQRSKLEAAAEALRPKPTAKPEYVVVWAGNSNASDMHTQRAEDDALTIQGDPLQTGSDAEERFVPGLDGFVVVDARKHNADGSANGSYGKVVNFVQLPLPWGAESEPHHMQYQWEDGQPILAGGLFNDTTFVMGVRDAPKIDLLNTIAPQDTPNGSVPDAYDAAGNGRLIGTYMGGPNYNYGGSPGEVVVFKPDPRKGLVVASETAAGSPGARQTGNPGGIPEPCNSEEAAPLDTCANPHGIQVRADLGRMVTSDYAEPKMVILDPGKPDGGRFFRPTVRVWDTSNVDQPRLTSVAHMQRGWRGPQEHTMHDNRGIMENAKTWPSTGEFDGTLPSKGFFAGAMCGGGVFFTPDITSVKPDSSTQWKQVFDDGIALVAARQGNIEQWMENEGPCQGGGWMQVSRNNRRLFRAVMGQAPNVENLANRGQGVKVIYDVDIQPLIQSAADGEVACDLAHGIDSDGDGRIDIAPTDAVKRVAQGEQVADCPRLIDTLTVDDPTSGGPHWGALDNHSLTEDGFPTRMVFSNYFVARSGVDGDHRMYMVDVDPKSGSLSYDDDWRDEVTGRLGFDFNRTNWPGNDRAGHYKPHSMVWVCPPGVCPENTPGAAASGAGP